MLPITGVAISHLSASYENFNQQHYQFHLHQYYKLEFNRTIDVLALMNELKQAQEIENIEVNYRLKINITPNDPYYSSQWAHENNGQAVSSSGANVGTPDCDTDTNQAWDITTGEDDVVIAILDTGVSEHVEFTGRLLEGYDFIDCDIKGELIQCDIFGGTIKTQFLAC